MLGRRLGRLAVLAGLAMAGTALVALPVAAQDQGKTIVGGFDVGPGGFPGNFNPLTATAGFTWLNTYYEPLVTYTADLAELTGELAEDYSTSEDLTTFTFNLADATWHDGEPFTSADVKFTFDLAMNAQSGSIFAARLGDVVSVETPDEKTAVVTLSGPNGGFLSTISQLMMLPEHILGSMPAAELAQSDWWSTSPVGTGPFSFVQYVSDQYVELEAFEDYRDGRPQVDQLINRYFADPAAAVAALRAGEIAFTYAEPDDAGSFEDDADFSVIVGDSFVLNYIGFNHRTELWDDVRVRQAVMHAIDRDAIIESLYNGAATKAQCNYVAPQYVPDDLVDYSYDPEKARSLLAEAGWDQINGTREISWVTYYDSPQVANIMAAIQSMLAEVGINVVPRVVDVPTYNGIVRGDDVDQFPMVYAGAGNGPNPAQHNINLNSGQTPPNGNNIMHIALPELDAALETAMSEADPEQMAARWQDVCRIVNEEMPWGSMWVANRYGIASNALENFVWTPAPGGGPFEMNPEDWDITAE
ncbi:ABC transporter substrate-binding protein [Pelagibacterium halotolerans]|uniref:ABC transporter substrate-binding protein n=1 Tax=Pelagibacterium halotolerans TaxID=531813 RepID=UPI00059F1012|nr:ABC transporter substrate-binding protein [Pelagibacterium halotolerans]SEA87635.1 peptide/nickel transport system substrate-binding protein [Pelagibacterium halotolerans]